MPDPTTPNYGWSYPVVNADSDTWGDTQNNTLLAIDAALFAVSGVASNASTLATAACAKANNLSDLANIPTARTNLGLGNAALATLTRTSVPVTVSASFANGHIPVFNTDGSIADSSVLQTDLSLLSQNLAGIGNATTALSNLGITLTRVAQPVTVSASFSNNHIPVFNTDGSVADSGIVNSNIILASNNLSDIPTPATARANLGVTRTNLGILSAKTTAKTGSSIGSGQVWTESHSIGAVPSVYNLAFQLTCLSGELSYSAGDVVVLESGMGGSQNDGIVGGMNSSQLFWAIGSNGIRLIQKNGGAATYITPANWSLVLQVRYEN